RPPDAVREADAHVAQLLDPRFEPQEIVVARRAQVPALRLDDRQLQPLRLNALVGEGGGAQVLVTRHFEPAKLIGVIRDAQLIRVTVEHAHVVGADPRRARWGHAPNHARSPTGVADTAPLTRAAGRPVGLSSQAIARVMLSPPPPRFASSMSTSRHTSR